MSLFLFLSRQLIDDPILEFPNLLHLNLSSLDLPSPCDVPIGSIFTTLQVLDVSNTGIGDTEVMRILSRMKQLLEIKLTGCRSISVSALSFLGRGEVECFRFWAIIVGSDLN